MVDHDYMYVIWKDPYTKRNIQSGNSEGQRQSFSLSTAMSIEMP